MDTEIPQDQQPAKPARRPITGRVEFHDTACELAESARLELVIQSFALEREIYGETRFIKAVRDLATRSSRAKIRILVNSPEWAGRSGHRLIELARRLTSFIEIRGLAEQDKAVVNELLVADESSKLERESPEQLKALYYPSMPGDAREALRRFETLWFASQPVPDFRQLGI